MVFPYRRAFLRHAMSSYKLMIGSAKPHQVGLANAPTEEEWETLIHYCGDQSPADCSFSEFFSAYATPTDVDL
jgi:hypothetical protein